MKEKFKIALAQISCRREDKKANLQKIEEYAKKGEKTKRGASGVSRTFVNRLHRER